MTIEVDFWQLVVLAIALLGGYAALGKLLLASTTKGINQQFSALQKMVERIENECLKNDAETRRIWEKCHSLEVLLVDKYVKREDFVRSHAVIESKVDALHQLFAGAQP